MTVTHSQWYRSLDTETKSAIRQLHQLKPVWNLTAILFVLLWACAGWLVMTVPNWGIRIVGYVFMGMLLHGIGNFMHEGIHGNLFRHRRWDRWFGFLAGAPTFFPVSAYGGNHLLHHKYTRTEQDPDEFLYISQNKRMRTILFYVWFMIGALIFSIRVPFVVQTRCSRQERIAALTERLYITLAAGCLFLLAYRGGFLDVLLHCWMIPLVVAGFLGNVRGWAEHQMTATDHPLRQTRTVKSHPVYSFLNINLNYHLEHHLFPGVPWYNLPALHRVLLPEYKRVGVSVYESYFWFLWDAFRIGIHGQTPDLQMQTVPHQLRPASVKSKALKSELEPMKPRGH